MPYCITLRSRTDALITGWYDGSDSRWSTDRYRQKVFNNKRDARPVCDELRTLCPRNAEIINIEAEQDDPSRDAIPAMFSPGIECYSEGKVLATVSEVQSDTVVRSG